MIAGSDTKPVRRMMRSRFGDSYVVELRQELVMIRPKGARRQGKSEVAVPVGAIYQRAILSAMAAEKAARRKTRSRR